MIARKKRAKWKIDWVGSIACILAVVGVILNNNKLSACFLVWIVSNTLCAVCHCRAKLWPLAVRDIIFIVLAVDGLWRWNYG